MPASDIYAAHGTGLDAPASRWFAITPSDSTDLSAKPRAIYVGGTGDLSIANGTDTVTLVGVPAGTLLPIRPDRVRATGTTATYIVALY